jgi:outer membrane lipoprotein-sorting protein
MTIIKNIITLLLCCFINFSFGQDIQLLVKKAKSKIDLVNDYQASGTMKTNVAFLKVPVAKVKLFFKKPNKLKLKSENGLSFIPKGAMSINVGSLFSDLNYTILDAGNDNIDNVAVRVAKLIPNDDNSEIVLSVLYIDPVRNVIVKTKTTTKENGTYELMMTYKKYIEFGLPDKILFSFNTKDYKLPKGITFDFDDGAAKENKAKEIKNKKGNAEIILYDYIVNKGLSAELFK